MCVCVRGGKGRGVGGRQTASEGSLEKVHRDEPVAAYRSKTRLLVSEESIITLGDLGAIVVEREHVLPKPHSKLCISIHR